VVLLLDDATALCKRIKTKDDYVDSIRMCVMVARSVRDWREVSMDRSVGWGPLPMAEQEEGFSLLILVCFISHPLIT
jgi:hypothetical protein